MKKHNIIRYAALAVVLGLCGFSAPLQAGGLKGNTKAAGIVKKVKETSTKVKETSWQRESLATGTAVPEPSSLLASLVAGAGLCGVGLYHRRRSRP